MGAQLCCFTTPTVLCLDLVAVRCLSVWPLVRLSIQIQEAGDLLFVNQCAIGACSGSFGFGEFFPLQSYIGLQPCQVPQAISPQIVSAAFHRLYQSGYSIKFRVKFLGVGYSTSLSTGKQRKELNRMKSMTTSNRHTGNFEKKDLKE